MPVQWYQKSVGQVLKEHGLSDSNGLTNSQCRERSAQYGPNILPDRQSKGPFQIFLHQFSDFLVLVLLVSAFIAGFLGEAHDVAAIITIVLLNAILGFVQEYRAERAMDALKQLTAPHAKVRRAGQVFVLPASELVPGDIVLLEAGAMIPADLRLIETVDLQLDESTFTGESLPVIKHRDVIPENLLPVAEQKNMVFKGTLVTSGRGVGLVTSIGQNTELGKIAQLLRQEVEVQTPLQRRLTQFARRLAIAVLLLCGLVVLMGVLRGENPVLMFMTGISLAVAAIPEALPAVVTVSLALGARIMSRNRALIRKLSAVEALGSVTYICTDKTGTLTENRMTVMTAYMGSKELELVQLLTAKTGDWQPLIQIMAQSNDAYADLEGLPQGDPTEIALYSAANELGFAKAELDAHSPRVAEIPFSSERGMMSTLHREDSKIWLYSKGAPERILERCVDQIQLDGRVTPIDVVEVRDKVQAMSARGLRVLALARKQLVQSVDSIDLSSIESELIFVGLVGLMDPPRVEAKEAMQLCRSAGIRVMMMTGDHPDTARSIAQQLNLCGTASCQVMSGQVLQSLSEAELLRVIHEVAVFARVAPSDKIRIVKALQTSGEVVAMTGDGVNDAPALRRSDIGVAMGKGGTDVAKEASHMVLLDDNFATIVGAVQEGRRIYDNIRKFVRFALSGNSGEIWTLLAAPLLMLPTPLLPIQILWVNLVTDGLPGLALALEPAEKSVMRRPPRHPKESIFSRGLGWHTIWVGVLTAVVTLSVMAWAYYGGRHWQSIAFSVLTFIQMGHVLAIRSEEESLFTLGLRSNLPLLGAVILTFVLQGLVLYVPILNKWFSTDPLTPGELVVTLVASLTIFIAVEVEKFWRRRSRLG